MLLSSRFTISKITPFVFVALKNRLIALQDENHKAKITKQKLQNENRQTRIARQNLLQ